MNGHKRNWAAYFSHSLDNAGGPMHWLAKKWHTHQSVYGVLMNLAPHARMLEIGCGLAATSIAMNLRGFSNTALDIDPKVLTLTKRLVRDAGANVSLEQGDMFDLTKFYGKFDIVYSGGVLEHLNEKEAIQLLAEQGKVAQYVVTVIPTKSEIQKAPIPRYPYGLENLINFGIEAGLKPDSVFLFKGIKPASYKLDKHVNIDEFIQSLDQLPAERIGIVYQSS